MAEHHAVPEGEVVEQQGGDGVEGEEPAAGLVHRLRDEVGGEAAAEQLLVLERVVVLRERHRAGVEPGVDHLLDAAHACRRRSSRTAR